MSVVVIFQIKDAGKAGSGGQFLIPSAVFALRLDQVLDSFVQAVAGGVAAGDQPADRPGGLRGSRFGGNKRLPIVGSAALAPAAVSVLNRPQPLAGAQNVGLAIVLPGRPQPAQGEAGAINIIDAPAPVPASIGLLRPLQISDSAPDGGVARLQARGDQPFQNASGNIRASRIEHRVMVREGNRAERLPV